MTLTDFLVARYLETLEAHCCDYFVAGDRVICNCESPSAPVAQVLDKLDLVRWSDRTLGPNNLVESLLADQYATHPDYNPEWHFVTGVE